MESNHFHHLKHAIRRRLPGTNESVFWSAEEERWPGPIRILIVDDSEPMRVFLREILTAAGYAVAEAHDGEEALRLYNAQPAELVITDLIMPKKEGLETIMELRRRFSGVKILAISGGSRVTGYCYLSIAKKMGVQRTLPKPFHPAELLQTVREILAGN